MAPRTFEHQSFIPTTLAQMIAFHRDPAALRRLTPPPVFIQVHRDDRTALTEGEIEMTMWFGPLPARWLARHEPGPTPASFADRQISGPMKAWRHEHIFAEEAGGVRLTDRVTYEYPQSGFWGLFTRVAFHPLNLRVLFAYRHWRTRLGTKTV